MTRLSAPLRRLVLLGGPCSGKTTILNRLRATFTSELQCVPEAATMLITHAALKPPYHSPDQEEFVRAVYLAHQSLELAGEIQARLDGKRAVILDCCTLVCAAYWPHELGAFERFLQVDIATDRLRFDGAILLEVAPPNVFADMATSNPARHHDYEESLAAGQRLLAMWDGHPGLIRIPAYAAWEEKVAATCSAVRALLAT